MGEISQERFENAKEKIIGINRQRHSIGVLSEKTVHAILKNYYEPDEDKQEIPVEGLVADIYDNGNIIEIQTAHFYKLREKLARFLPYYDVTIVYPVPRDKWIIWIDEETGETSPARKSPIHGNAYFIFPELYRIKTFLKNEHINFRVALLDMEEYKVLEKKKRGRGKKGRKYDRIPKVFVEEVDITCKEDYLQFLPIELDDEFTTSDLAKAAKIHVSLARMTVNILHYVGVIDKVGKMGNKIIYRILE